MTIYVITSAVDGDLAEVTTRASTADIWRGHGFDVAEAPDATADELAAVAALNQWLYDNYNAGAHWIIETTPDERHVIELRRQTPGQYRVALERHWRTMSDYCDDVRNA